MPFFSSYNVNTEDKMFSWCLLSPSATMKILVVLVLLKCDVYLLYEQVSEKLTLSFSSLIDTVSFFFFPPKHLQFLKIRCLKMYYVLYFARVCRSMGQWRRTSPCTMLGSWLKSQVGNCSWWFREIGARSSFVSLLWRTPTLIMMVSYWTSGPWIRKEL